MMKIEFEIQITFFSKYQMIVLTHTFAIPRKKLMGKVDKEKHRHRRYVAFHHFFDYHDFHH